MAQTWLDYRNSTPQQRLFCRALTKAKPFEDIFSPHILFGASGYCGKSYGLRTAAGALLGDMRDRGFPGFRVTLFCDTYPNLRDRHFQGFIDEMGDLGELSEDKIYGLCFKFFDRSMGLIRLRNCDTYRPGARRGFEGGHILIDEITELMRVHFEHIKYGMRGTVRVDGKNVAVPYKSLGAATNPDGRGTAWVRKFWVPKYRDISDKFFEEIGPENWILIKARPEDNPTFDANIKAILTGFSDPMLVQSRWFGSWDILGSMRFGTYNRTVHGFTWDQFWVYYDLPRDLSRDRFLAKCTEFGFKLFGSLDYGTAVNAASAFHLHLVDPNKKTWTFGERYMQGQLLPAQAKRIRSAIDGLPISRIYADPALGGRAANDEQIDISRQAKFRNHGVLLDLGINDRVEGWATFDEFLDYDSIEDGDSFFVTREPMWRINYSECPHLDNFLQDAPRDEKNPEDVHKDFEDDHAGDGPRYFLHSHFGRGIVRKVEPKPFTVGWWSEMKKAEQSGLQREWGSL